MLGTHMTPLTPKMKEAIEALVADGASVFSAGAACGVTKSVISEWMLLGSTDKVPDGPKMDGELKKFSGGDAMLVKDWVLHVKRCIALHKAVTIAEGARLSLLSKMMWKRATKQKFADPDMQKFLFKHYGHIHGLSDAPAGKDKEPAAPTGPRLVLAIPDNGRGPK